MIFQIMILVLGIFIGYLISEIYKHIKGKHQKKIYYNDIWTRNITTKETNLIKQTVTTTVSLKDLMAMDEYLDLAIKDAKKDLFNQIINILSNHIRIYKDYSNHSIILSIHFWTNEFVTKSEE